MIPTTAIINEHIYDEEALLANGTFTILSLIATMLYLGVGLNINLKLFNLIPLPPLDGSRIAYIFLPTNIYFKIMQYERYIMIGFIVLLATGIINLPLGSANAVITNGLFEILDMPLGHLYYTYLSAISRLPVFSL